MYKRMSLLNIFKSLLILSIFVCSVNTKADELDVMQGYLSEAQGLLQKKEYDSASIIFKRLTRIKNFRADAMIGLSMCELGKGNVAEAGRIISEYKEENPMHIDVRLQYAEVLIAKQELDEALREINAVEYLRKNYNPAIIKKVRILLRKEKIKEAEEALAKADEDKENGAEILYLRAQINNRNGNILLSISLFEEYLKKYNPNEKILVELAQAYTKVKKFKEAEASFRRAIQLAPQEYSVWIQYADHLIEQNRNEEAVKVLMSARDLNTTDASLVIKLAQCYVKMGNYELAQSYYKDVLQIDKTNDDAMYGLLKIYELKKQVDLIGATLQEWVQKHPEKTWAVMSYARILVGINHFDLAKNVIKRSLSSNDGQPELKDFLVKIQKAEMLANRPKLLADSEPQTVAYTKVKTESEDPIIKKVRDIASEQVESETINNANKPYKQEIINKSESIDKSKEISDDSVPRIQSEINRDDVNANSVMNENNATEAMQLEEYEVVRRGDTLGYISSRVYGTSKRWKEIFNSNRDKLTTPEDISVGMKLKIPNKNKKQITNNFENIKLKSSAPERKSFYFVKKGDTLGKISAALYGTTKQWKRIYSLNQKILESPNLLEPGMKLKLPKNISLQSDANNTFTYKFSDLLQQASSSAKDTNIFDKIIASKFAANEKVKTIDTQSLSNEDDASSIILPPTKTKQTTSSNVVKNNDPNGIILPDTKATLSTIKRDEVYLEKNSPTTPGVEFFNEKRWSFSLSAGPNVERVMANGQSKVNRASVSTTERVGYVAGASVNYRFPLSPVSIHAEGLFSKTRYDDLRSPPVKTTDKITAPNMVYVKRERYMLTGIYQPYYRPVYSGTTLESFYLMLGHGWTYRKAQNTFPITIITSHYTQEILLGLGATIPLSERYGLENGIRGYFPYKFKEKNIITGYHDYSVNVEVSSGIVRNFESNVSLSLSLVARLEINKFDLGGTRNLQNVTENDWIFSAPIKVRF